jgi:voltage-gated potassium channel
MPRTAREHLHEIIFEADTPEGRAFDVALLVLIVTSVAAVSLDSVDQVRARIGPALWALEWVVTALFTVEYVLRLYCVERPLAYARSFFGLVDLLAVLPTYLSLLVPGAESLIVIRVLRLLRVFRVLKLVRYLSEETVLVSALRSSRRKIVVFVCGVLSVCLIAGTLMYLIEGKEAGFTSIPRGVYWAIVTITTVGYGDIAPRTVAGQMLAMLLMITGYGIIAVPTGIVGVEVARATMHEPTTQVCRHCLREGHDADARFCKFCGAALQATAPSEP